MIGNHACAKVANPSRRGFHAILFNSVLRRKLPCPTNLLAPLALLLKRQIGQGNIEDAIEQLENYLRDNAPGIYNELLTQAARFRTLNRRHLAGEITTELFNVEEARIRKWLLAFVDSLPAKIDPRLLPVRRAASAAEAIPFNTITTEKILGINNLRQISWLERGIQVCKSVCRILTPSGLGTGFLIGPGLVMTNNHVIQSTQHAAGSVVEFDYQQDGTGNLKHAVRYHLDVSIFRTSSELDYTLVGVKSEPQKPPLTAWGSLRLNPYADPVPTEHVSIIQHPKEASSKSC